MTSSLNPALALGLVLEVPPEPPLPLVLPPDHGRGPVHYHAVPGLVLVREFPHDQISAT